MLLVFKSACVMQTLDNKYFIYVSYQVSRDGLFIYRLISGNKWLPEMWNILIYSWYFNTITWNYFQELILYIAFSRVGYIHILLHISRMLNPYINGRINVAFRKIEIYTYIFIYKSENILEIHFLITYAIKLLEQVTRECFSLARRIIQTLHFVKVQKYQNNTRVWDIYFLKIWHAGVFGSPIMKRWSHILKTLKIQDDFIFLNYLHVSLSLKHFVRIKNPRKLSRHQYK